jgi:hypothetical protein
LTPTASPGPEQVATEAPSTPTSTSNPSPTPRPSNTEKIPATDVPDASPTPITAVELSNPLLNGQVIGGGVNLRSGPSQLFPILETLPYQTPVGVLNAVPGRQWLQVVTEDGITGWMAAQYIQTNFALEAIPLAPISEDWLVLKGSVKDSASRPLVSVNGMLYDSQGHLATTRSWEDGYFYLFLPKGSPDHWMLRVSRPACYNSSINPQCPGPGFFIDNPRAILLVDDKSIEIIFQLGEP